MNLEESKMGCPGESASAAFARRLGGKTDGQIKQMINELESGEPS
jgi:hypothetical protein